MQALQLLLERARQRGEEEVALRWATRLLAAEPWQEEAQRQLMRLLARRGQRQAALQQYAVCCRVLREKLGRTPHAATQALYEQLCAGPLALPHNLPSLPGTFVGREREVATLRTRLGDAASRLITLLGLGGSGKTTIVMLVSAARSGYKVPAPGSTPVAGLELQSAGRSIVGRELLGPRCR